MAYKYTRKNIWANGGTFDDPTILWYARGVGAMKTRALAEPTGWRFYGGIHGFNSALWKLDGYLSDSDQLPTSQQQALFWKQCQHGSWYFLPWHRGYLLALEAVIRAAVVAAGGPSDWALPYWNYFGGGNQNQLPPAFASQDWPDGTGNNPLFVEQRWGPNDDGNVFVQLDQVNLDALTVPDFTGVPLGDPGFGGIDTGFSHGGGTHGDLESQPHDMVHVLVGGGNPQNPNLPGLMTNPNSAGLDPIFYLHHANIDRLWETWVQEPTSLGNPTDTSWLNGPAASGQRAFVMPWPDGTNYTYTPADVGNLAQLDYVYDDLTAAAAATTESVAARAKGGRRAAASAAVTEGVAPMPSGDKNVELVGSNDQPVRVAGRAESRASVRLQEGPRRRMEESIARATQEGPGSGPADRVFLHLENVRGLSDAAAFEVFVNGRSAGSVALFGVTEATSSEEGHGGAGLNFVLEISKIVDELHLESALDANTLDVRIVPVRNVPEAANVTIGKISVARQES